MEEDTAERGEVEQAAYAVQRRELCVEALHLLAHVSSVVVLAFCAFQAVLSGKRDFLSVFLPCFTQKENLTHPPEHDLGGFGSHDEPVDS